MSYFWILDEEEWSLSCCGPLLHPHCCCNCCYKFLSFRLYLFSFILTSNRKHKNTMVLVNEKLWQQRILHYNRGLILMTCFHACALYHSLLCWLPVSGEEVLLVELLENLMLFQYWQIDVFKDILWWAILLLCNYALSKCHTGPLLFQWAASCSSQFASLASWVNLHHMMALSNCGDFFAESNLSDVV